MTDWEDPRVCTFVGGASISLNLITYTVSGQAAQLHSLHHLQQYKTTRYRLGPGAELLKGCYHAKGVCAAPAANFRAGEGN